MKKTFTILAVLFCLTPALPVWSAIVTGTCGDNLSYSLNTRDSTLTITGSGAMADYNNWGDNQTPWGEYKSYIANVVFPKVLTSVGNYSFYECRNFLSVSLPDSVTAVGDGAFAHCTKLASLTLDTALTPSEVMRFTTVMS